uniref:NADH-ubiquinone oxidoreductase chain 2 n=1 Tax=Enchiridium sp. MTA_2015 TaxID=1712692 RepID=A0A0P0BZT0_9PLAT|nr:NADH dehydrogenase subunit 2 [Enchiridium sp. MTA_2015]ALI86930.1 NADH dehydrogenase subunit 2 [Enchiridium sp. MTA_2015]
MFGIFISILSSNLFLVWLGLEINMFGIIPFMLLNNREVNDNEINVGIYYFLVQVLGSMLFAWGSILGNFSILGVMGLCIKLGVPPFFWWVPSVFNRLDWFSIILMSTVQKVPLIILIRLAFDLSLWLSLLICFLGLVISAIGINFSNNQIKLLMAWSSIGNMSLFFCLFNFYFNMAIIYFVCYSISVFGVGLILFKNGVNLLDSNSENGINIDLLLNVSLAVLIFSGLPPLLGFISKIYLFSGLSVSEGDLMIKQIEVMDNNNYMVEYPIYKDLGGWSVSLILSGLLILQVVAYIKVFINIYGSFFTNLESSSRSTSLSWNIDYFLLLILISSGVILMI